MTSFSLNTDHDPLREVAVMSDKVRKQWNTIFDELKQNLAVEDEGGCNQILQRHIPNFIERIHKVLDLLPPCLAMDKTLRDAYDLYKADIFKTLAMTSMFKGDKDAAYDAYSEMIHLCSDGVMLMETHFLAINCLLEGGRPARMERLEALEHHVHNVLELCFEGEDEELKMFLEKTTLLYRPEDNQARAYMAFIISHYTLSDGQKPGIPEIMKGLENFLMGKLEKSRAYLRQALTLLEEEAYPATRELLQAVLVEKA